VLKVPSDAYQLLLLLLFFADILPGTSKGNIVGLCYEKFLSVPRRCTGSEQVTSGGRKVNPAKLRLTWRVASKVLYLRVTYKPYDWFL